MNPPQMPDHLFDPDAAADAEVASLERALAPLRWRASDAPGWVLDGSARPGPASRGRRHVLLLGLVAALVAVMLSWWLADSGPRPGSPAQRLAAVDGALQLGEQVRLSFAPDAELEFVRWQARGELRLRLLRGRAGIELLAAGAAEHLVATLVVETPAGELEIGGQVVGVPLRPSSGVVGSCELVVVGEDRGAGGPAKTPEIGAVRVRGTGGTVAFSGGGRRVVVPGGASCETGEAGAVTTPRFERAEPAVVRLLEIYDRALVAGDAERRAEVADKLRFGLVGPHTSLPLWHMLVDDDPAVQKLARDGLRTLLGPPRTAEPGESLAAVWLRRLLASQWR